MTSISIKDSLFAHAFSSSGWYKPSYFEWDRTNNYRNFIILTDNHVFEADFLPSHIKKYAWLVESPILTTQSYDWIAKNANKFDLIFTHNRNIIEQNSHAILIPIGGCHLLEDEISLDYEKTKLISMMYSLKKFAPGHAIRFSVAEHFSEVVDVMGSGLTGTHVKKIYSCKDYMYSVAIENCKEDYYFSEKIIDCFLSGVIPIYWGCPSIAKFFDEKGMFQFDTIPDLYSFLEKQEFLYEYYIKNRDVIVKNFNTALKYKIAEDYMWNLKLQACCK